MRGLLPLLELTERSVHAGGLLPLLEAHSPDHAHQRTLLLQAAVSAAALHVLHTCSADPHISPDVLQLPRHRLVDAARAAAASASGSEPSSEGRDVSVACQALEQLQVRDASAADTHARDACAADTHAA